MAQRIDNFAMTRLDAYLIYQINYKPALTYPLHHTLFTDSQCNSIQSSVINAILPKMGFNRHMPWAVIFSPKLYGGSGLADAKVEQAVILITDMITDIQRSNLVGKQFVLLIANYQRYLVGASFLFFLGTQMISPTSLLIPGSLLSGKKCIYIILLLPPPYGGGPQSRP